jgi:uncharacterized protein (TIGR02118 family)
MYPNQEGGTFNHDYYRDTHMALVREHLGPHGLVKIGIEKGLGGGGEGEQPPYMCIGSLYFDSEEQYRTAMGAVGTVLRDDIPNFTNVTPVRQINEVVE